MEATAAGIKATPPSDSTEFVSAGDLLQRSPPPSSNTVAPGTLDVPPVIHAHNAPPISGAGAQQGSAQWPPPRADFRRHFDIRNNGDFKSLSPSDGGGFDYPIGDRRHRRDFGWSDIWRGGGLPSVLNPALSSLAARRVANGGQGGSSSGGPGSSVGPGFSPGSDMACGIACRGNWHWDSSIKSWSPWGDGPSWQQTGGRPPTGIGFDTAPRAMAPGTSNSNAGQSNSQSSTVNYDNLQGAVNRAGAACASVPGGCPAGTQVYSNATKAVQNAQQASQSSTQNSNAGSSATNSSATKRPVIINNAPTTSPLPGNASSVIQGSYSTSPAQQSTTQQQMNPISGQGGQPIGGSGLSGGASASGGGGGIPTGGAGLASVSGSSTQTPRLRFANVQSTWRPGMPSGGGWETEALRALRPDLRQPSRPFTPIERVNVPASGSGSGSPTVAVIAMPSPGNPVRAPSLGNPTGGAAGGSAVIHGPTLRTPPNPNVSIAPVQSSISGGVLANHTTGNLHLNNVQTPNVSMSNVHVSTPAINAMRTTVRTPNLNIATPTVRTPTVNVKVATPNVKVPTVNVRVPTVNVKVPTVNVRVPTVNVRVPTVSVPTISDIRLKHDIVQLGELPNGLHLYRYRYLWSDVSYVGVMAQEVAAIAPSAVVQGADGYLRVDYDQLGLGLATWDEWAARCGKSCSRAQ